MKGKRGGGSFTYSHAGATNLIYPENHKKRKGPSPVIQQMGVTAAQQQKEQKQRELEEARHNENDGDNIDVTMDPTVSDSDTDDQPSYHSKKKAALQQNWKDTMADMQDTYINNMDSNMKLKEDTSATTLAAIQCRLDQLWSHHRCALAGDAQLFNTDFTRLPNPVAVVNYYGLTCEDKLSLHQWTCNKCCQQVIVPANPLQFGCFPSTPVQPHIWYDLTLLQLYQQFGPLEGLSATGERCK